MLDSNRQTYLHIYMRFFFFICVRCVKLFLSEVKYKPDVLQQLLAVKSVWCGQIHDVYDACI